MLKNTWIDPGARTRGEPCTPDFPRPMIGR